MLLKNENWKGKVRIVCLSTDDSIEAVLKRVEEKKWNLIEHLKLNGEWPQPIMKQYGIFGIPFVFLLDKEGIVKYKGHPSSIHLESAINNLLNGKDIDVAGNSEESKLVSFDEFHELSDGCDKFLELNKTILPNDQFGIKISIQKK